MLSPGLPCCMHHEACSLRQPWFQVLDDRPQHHAKMLLSNTTHLKIPEDEVLMALQHRSHDGQHELGVNTVKGPRDVHTQNVWPLLAWRARSRLGSCRRPPPLEKWLQTGICIIVAKHSRAKGLRLPRHLKLEHLHREQVIVLGVLAFAGLVRESCSS